MAVMTSPRGRRALRWIVGVLLLLGVAHWPVTTRQGVNFEVATRSAVGPKWREASPEQRTKLQAEFKTMLMRLYAGALTQLKDQTVEITKTQPVAGSTQVVVQSEVRGKGEPIKLDYRLDKYDAAWKIKIGRAHV